MLTIDGRTGGGQLLRSAVSLSALTSTPFTIEDVRGARPEPGLKPQHLAAVRAVGGLCEAEVTGAELDSEELTFEPGPIRAADQVIDIGTAGSVTLLFDAVLPLAVRIDSPVELTATGGTDVKWSPTIAFARRVKLPLLGLFGLRSEISVERTGFYPAGGGRATIGVEPSTLTPIDLPDRGPIDSIEVFSKASKPLADAEVAERQAVQATELLEDHGLPVDGREIEYVEATSDGSSLLLRAAYADSVAGFDNLGERGKPSETVAEEAVDRLLAFHRGRAAVDEHLADQLLVFIALAGGRIRIPRITDHVASNRDLITRFGFDLELDEQSDGTVIVTG